MNFTKLNEQIQKNNLRRKLNIANLTESEKEELETDLVFGQSPEKELVDDEILDAIKGNENPDLESENIIDVVKDNYETATVDLKKTELEEAVVHSTARGISAGFSKIGGITKKIFGAIFGPFIDVFSGKSGLVNIYNMSTVKIDGVEFDFDPKVIKEQMDSIKLELENTEERINAGVTRLSKWYNNYAGELFYVKKDQAKALDKTYQFIIDSDRAKDVDMDEIEGKEMARDFIMSLNSLDSEEISDGIASILRKNGLRPTAFGDDLNLNKTTRLKSVDRHTAAYNTEEIKKLIYRSTIMLGKRKEYLSKLKTVDLRRVGDYRLSELAQSSAAIILYGLLLEEISAQNA